jgi:hypothetical protein
MIRLVIPEEPAVDAAPAAEARAPARQQLRIGTLDNSKSNADHLLGDLVRRLSAQMPVQSVVQTRKPGAALSAREDVLDTLATEADCVITAMAD